LNILKSTEWLKTVGDWNFDTIEFSNKIRKEPMLEIGKHIYSQLDLTQTFNIDSRVIIDFLRTCEAKYLRTNYYHNNIHAADVTNSAFFLLTNGLYKRGNMTDLEQFALITGSLCHDIAHPGVNNAFLVASRDQLAFKYNDQSVLESMHASLCFRIMHRESSNIGANLSREDWITFRKLTVDVILATDLQKHFVKVGQLKELLEAEVIIDMEVDENRKLALEMTLKCADIAHGAKNLDLHKYWSGLITREFFLQGDKEREAGIAVSPLCDREKVVLSTSQKGFLSFLVMPLFDSYTRFIE
jgi:hypothetical protein